MIEPTMQTYWRARLARTRYRDQGVNLTVWIYGTWPTYRRTA